MDITKLKRDATKVHDALYETDTGQLIARKTCRIYIPTRYNNTKLASIANEIRIVGIYAITVDDTYYGVSLTNATMQITPSSTSIVKLDGDEYYEFTFDAGSVITPNYNLVKDSFLVYYIYDEIVAKGHIPWYISYTDLGKLFISSVKHGGLVLGPNNTPLEMIAASITRSRGDRTKYYRHTLDHIENELIKPPAFIAFRSIIYGPTNTTAKFMGAYFEEGMMSALVNPAETTEGVETLLRL